MQDSATHTTTMYGTCVFMRGGSTSPPTTRLPTCFSWPRAALAGGLNPVGALPPPIQQLRQGLDEMDISRYTPRQRSAVLSTKSAIDSRDVSATSSSISQMLDLFGGADLWKSLNGVHWFPVTINGFDNHLNFGFRRIVSVHEQDLRGLVVGTANAFTGHPRGGSEILLGTNPYTIGSE